jgi:hypothetical protein
MNSLHLNRALADDRRTQMLQRAERYRQVRAAKAAGGIRGAGGPARTGVPGGIAGPGGLVGFVRRATRRAPASHGAPCPQTVTM